MANSAAATVAASVLAVGGLGGGTPSEGASFSASATAATAATVATSSVATACATQGDAQAAVRPQTHVRVRALPLAQRQRSGGALPAHANGAGLFSLAACALGFCATRGPSRRAAGAGHARSSTKRRGLMLPPMNSMTVTAGLMYAPASRKEKSVRKPWTVAITR